jgi:hypothetical protein
MYRFYDDTDPIVGNAIRLHTELPLSRVSLTDCGYPGVQDHFEEMWRDRIQGPQLLFAIGAEYWRIGNVYPFGAWNDQDMMWEKFAILNPDDVMVESTLLATTPLIALNPNDKLREIVRSMRPKFLYDQLTPEVVRYVREKRNIPLDPRNVFHLAHNKAPYEIYGKSLIKRILKILMYEDRIHEAQFAIAARHISPMTLVKVGDPTSGWIPSQSEIDAVAEMFAAAEIDPNFSIFWHYGINVEFVGAAGKVLPVYNELTRVDELKLTGLGISKAMVHGEGPTFATAQVGLEILRQRYIAFQSVLSTLIHEGIFRPVADVCGFYKQRNRFVSGPAYTGQPFGQPQAQPQQVAKRGAEIFPPDFYYNDEFHEFRVSEEERRKRDGLSKEYIYPRLNWERLTLNADQQYRRFLLELEEHLKERFPGGVIPRKMWYQLSDIDEAQALRALQDEQKQKGAVQPQATMPGVGIPGGGGISGPTGGPEALEAIETEQGLGGEGEGEMALATPPPEAGGGARVPMGERSVSLHGGPGLEASKRNDLLRALSRQEDLDALEDEIADLDWTSPWGGGSVVGASIGGGNGGYAEVSSPRFRPPMGPSVRRRSVRKDVRDVLLDQKFRSGGGGK